MTPEGTEPHRMTSSRFYLIMRAETEEALKLTDARWEEKRAPRYVKIQLLDMKEIEDFVDLYNRCFLASPDPFCPLTSEEARRLDSEGIFVARFAGKLSGFIACFVEKETEPIYGEITGIGVIPNRRRKGIATALIKRATQYFLDTGVDDVYCEVYEENVPSQMLIMAYGFKEVGRRQIPMSIPVGPEAVGELPSGKITRRLGLRPRAGYETCPDI